MATRMQQRRSTSSEWAAANPVLADGEIGWEKDTGIIKMGDGVTLWNQLPPVSQGLYLPVEGKAFDSERLDGLDSTAFATTGALTTTDTNRKNYVDALVLPAGANRSLVNHFGNVTTYPTTGVKVGDRCYRTDLFSDMFWNGGVWRQTERAGGTRADRAGINTGAGTALYNGFMFFETDTLFERRWDGTRWMITRWYGDRGGSATSMGAMPMMSLAWANAQIASATLVNYTAWTTTYAVPTAFLTSGDGGVPLMEYSATAGASIVFRTKGRVRITHFAVSDHGAAGRSSASIVASFYNGNLRGRTDTRQRTTGYAGSGLLEQYVEITADVLAGDTCGASVYQLNTAGTTASYDNFLTAMYL